MADLTLCVRRSDGAIRWVVPHAPDFTPDDAQTEDVRHLFGVEEAVSPATHRFVNGGVVRLTAQEEQARRAALLDERLDRELSIGDAVIIAAAENLSVLYPALPAPTRAQQDAFRAAVRASAKAILRASIRGAQHDG